MAAKKHQLCIIIVSAGVAGLTAALYLEKHGRHVTVFEQSRLATEMGAAFHITPNACKVMTNLGIDPVQGGAVYLQESVFMEDESGDVVMRMPKSGKFKELPKGEDWLLCHRYHLHKQLKGAAVERGVNLVTKKRVTKVELEKSQVICEDGPSHTAHMIIGADGVHSKVRVSLYPGVEPYCTPYAAFRFTLDRSEIAKRAPAFHKDMFHFGTMYMWGKPETTLLVYLVSNDTQWNFVCLFPTRVLDIDAEHDSQYSKKATTDQLQYVYRDFEHQVQELIRMADKEHLRFCPLMDMENLQSYAKGNVALIGDSAHPFLPFAYQGASLAIADGAAIAYMLEGVTKAEDLYRVLDEAKKLKGKHGMV